MTCAMLSEHLDAIRAELGGLGPELAKNAYVFSNDPKGASPWNPDWATHKASDLAAAAGVRLNIKGCGITRPANYSRLGSTRATPPPALATAAAGPPLCGITLTPSLRSTVEPLRISHS